mmetsp:Transcript_2603/g.6109  ORF Transcript_2603/g.6109 Transcript_2603/m.6109 type:complete len:229 (-) Transcript_2603:507-1193(-)
MGLVGLIFVAENEMGFGQLFFSDVTLGRISRKYTVWRSAVLSSCLGDAVWFAVRAQKNRSPSHIPFDLFHSFILSAHRFRIFTEPEIRRLGSCQHLRTIKAEGKMTGSHFSHLGRIHLGHCFCSCHEFSSLGEFGASFRIPQRVMGSHSKVGSCILSLQVRIIPLGDSVVHCLTMRISSVRQIPGLVCPQNKMTLAKSSTSLMGVHTITQEGSKIFVSCRTCTLHLSR